MIRTAKNKIVLYGAMMTALMFAGLTACSDKNSGTARVEVRMTDAPGDYQEVNVDIQEVQIHADNGDPNSGWVSLSVRRGIYNLLKLSNGLDTLLGHADLPPGRVSQIRLILGPNNTVKINNVVTELTTPSAQQSGLKVKVDTDIREGITYRILLDFDAARSIVTTGSGKFILKPVIRTITTAQDGAIHGVVTPSISFPVVYAINGTDTVSTYASTSGNFLVKGLATGTYRLVLVPKPGYQTAEKRNVNVTVGSVSDVGVITIVQ